MPLLRRKNSSGSTRRFGRPMSMMVPTSSPPADEAEPSYDEQKKRISVLRRASVTSQSQFGASAISAPTALETVPPVIPRRSISRTFRPVSSYGALQAAQTRPPSPPSSAHENELAIATVRGRKISGPFIDRPTGLAISAQLGRRDLNSKLLPNPQIPETAGTDKSARKPLTTIVPPEFNYSKDSIDDEKDDVIVEGIDRSIGRWISISGDSPTSLRYKPLDYIDEDLPTTFTPPISPTLSDQTARSTSNDTLKSSASSVLTPKSSTYNFSLAPPYKEDVKIYQSQGVVYFNELKLLVKDEFRLGTTSALFSDENYNPFTEDEEELPKSKVRTQWVF